MVLSFSGASVQLLDWNRLVSICPFDRLGLPLLAGYVRLHLYLFNGPSEGCPVPVRVLQLETIVIGL